METLATAQVLDAIAAGQIEWIASTALRIELNQNPDPKRRGDTLDLLSLASTLIHPSPETLTRSHALRAEGYGLFDALHLAIAEQERASALLTVDDRFLRRAAGRPPGALPVVENPVDWLRRRHPWLIKR